MNVTATNDKPTEPLMPPADDVESLLNSFPAEPIPVKEGRPYMLLDGILKSAHNTLAGIAIGRAAHETLGVNVGYLCWQDDPSHYCHRLFRENGIEPVEWKPYIDEQSRLFKIWTRAQGAWHALLGGRRILDIEQSGVELGDLTYDSILRYNPGVFTIDDATTEEIRRAVVTSLLLRQAIGTLFEDRDIHSLVLSHKTYSRFGVPGRSAVKHGCPVFSRKLTHIKRIESKKEYEKSDFYVGVKELKNLVKEIGKKEIKKYSKKRMRGESKNYNNKCAFSRKKRYKEEALRDRLEVEENRPVAVIAPHIFSDEPHRDREMVYRDYYAWLLETVALAKDIPHVQWAVKAHPSASYYGEEGVVEEIARDADHLRLIPSDVKTDSVLRVADAVCTVRGTIGMEALLFDCEVVLAGNAYYEEIEAVQLCLDEDGYERALRSIEKKEALPDQTKEEALAALYYRKARFDHSTPLMGIERPPCLSEQEEREHDLPLIETAASFLAEHEYSDDRYYNALLNFFETGADRLSILDYLPTEAGERKLVE